MRLARHMIEKADNNNSRELLNFLVELRSRLIAALVVLFVLFAVFFYYANQLYTLLALPLLRYLPQGHLIATQIVSPFFVPVRLAFMASLLLAMPFILYQVWAFVSPALYGHERRLIWPFILMSTFLFYSGILFAYFVIFPMLFHFLSGIAPEGVVLSPDISEYLDFTIKLLLIFGTLFEIPIIMVLLVSARLVSRAHFIKWRPYAIVGAFVIGMLLAPPDVLSQTILAIPVWLLYETGILMTRFVGQYDKKIKC